MSAGQAVVVGASSAIGRAVAVDLAQLGYELTLWGRDRSRLEQAAASCEQAGSEPATIEVVDVTDRPTPNAAAARVAERPPVTALVWTAGLFDWAPADAADPDAWDQLFDVNLVAAAATTRLLLPALLMAAPSALVYIGSAAARQVFAGNAAYVASKHGLAGLAGAVFLDVRDRGVKVSLVSPSLVAAGAGLLAPAGQREPSSLLQPADVAAAVRFVVTFPDRGCPTEITLHPQRTPTD